MSVNQEIFNQYRESKIIEIVQEMGRSKVGSVLGFKGGTALRLFWGLPRYSQDMDYTLLPKGNRTEVYKVLLDLSQKMGYEVTDAAIKFRTVLFEYRFRWEGPTFRLKVEIASPLKRDLEDPSIPVRAASLRGVPVMVLAEGRLTAQKLCAFIQRDAPRDMYDLWFILSKYLKIEWMYVKGCLGLRKESDFFALARRKMQAMPKVRLVNDIGKFVGFKDREWLKKTFVQDLEALLLKREAEG